MPRHKWAMGHQLSKESIARRVDARKITMSARGNPCLRGPISASERQKTGDRAKAWYAADPQRRKDARIRMANLARSKKGQKQSPEHIAKRTAAAMATKARNVYKSRKGMVYKPWDQEKKKRFGEMARAWQAHKSIERTIVCEHCRGEKIKANIVQVKNQKLHFCSQSCYVEYLKANAATDPGILERRSGRYNNWRRRVLRRDKNACKNCGVEKSISKLHAHHILSYARFAQFRFDDWNGKTLCRRCHALVHRNHELRSKAEARRAM